MVRFERLLQSTAFFQCQLTASVFAAQGADKFYPREGGKIDPLPGVEMPPQVIGTGFIVVVKLNQRGRV
ncbi:hypothetical protein BEN49_06630 [Hymenobacter coccineus]|uniref:Uncharacterized protein n=1 Tax=Hymenobacter coccineus TaxID=1908235 RepID=A0A1G1THZ3_9BACT|nr:hypothetical protein BEN49_06630 [Hymenobacter coccineus]